MLIVGIGTKSYGFWKFRALKINLAPKKQGCNDAVTWLNEATSRMFRPTANFEIFEIHLYFRLIRLGYFYGYFLWFLSQMMTIRHFSVLDCLIRSFDWSDVMIK